MDFLVEGLLPTQSINNLIGKPTYGTKNHMSLLVPDVQKAVNDLESRPAFKTYGKELKVAVGVNQKRQVNIYDPDGTRVEMMEGNTITGQPTPPSTAPPPPPAHD
jgi:lactoylglutathione lyase